MRRLAGASGPVAAAFALVALTGLGGCTVVFDVPSREGVQIQPRPLGTDIGSLAARLPAGAATDASMLDLTRVGEEAGASRDCRDGRQSSVDGGGTGSDAVLRRLNGEKSVSLAGRHLRRGVARFGAGRYGDARSAFEAALAANPAEREFHALGRMYLGFIRCIEGDENGCALEFRRMYAEVPEFVVVAQGVQAAAWSGTLERVRARHRVAAACAPRLAAAPEAGRSPSAATGGLVTTPTGGPDAQIALAVSPGGKIIFDGHEVGSTPPARTLTVRPGLHTLTVVSDAAPPVTAELDIRAGERIEVQHAQQ